MSVQLHKILTSNKPRFHAVGLKILENTKYDSRNERMKCSRPSQLGNFWNRNWDCNHYSQATVTLQLAGQNLRATLGDRRNTPSRPLWDFLAAQRNKCPAGWNVKSASWRFARSTSKCSVCCNGANFAGLPVMYQLVWWYVLHTNLSKVKCGCSWPLMKVPSTENGNWLYTWAIRFSPGLPVK